MASPYDRLLGIPTPEEQGATQLIAPPNPTASLLPPSIAAQAAGATPAPPAAATNLLDPTKFLTVGEFFNSPGYKSALTPQKMELEKEYARTYLTPARMKAAGATQTSQILYGYWPAVKPAFWSIMLLRWDINVRESSVLGLVGAGGLGMIMNAAIDMFQWDRVAVILLTIFAVVVIGEIVITAFRRRLI